MKVERNADETMTRKGNGDTFSRAATNSWGSLNHLKATDVTRAIAEMKAKGNKSWDRQSFRVARVGPGWVLGQTEALSDVANPGVCIAGALILKMFESFFAWYPLHIFRRAVSKCELHYISYEKLKEIEERDPVLILKLYKLLASLMAKRQSVTINQLATLHSIMSSTSQKRPFGRSTQSGLASSFFGSSS